MDKLYERYADISEDIQSSQTAQNKFNESIVASRKIINESVNFILDKVSKKKFKLLKQIDVIHSKDKKQSQKICKKVSKQSLKNKEQFNVIATNNNSSPSQKTEALKKLLTVNGDDDDEKNESESYDHFKIIGDECVASGEVNAKFDKNALDTFLQSFMNIECDQSGRIR